MSNTKQNSGKPVKRITRLELTKDEALEMFKDNPYKIDILN